MSPARQLRLPHLLSLALILCCWTTGLAGLDRFPKIYEDESWIAAPGYNFWEHGSFSTDLFAGFYGMERHYYDFPPVFSLLVGGALHLFGMGLFQARIVPLALITLTLALTHRLGAKYFSPWHGTLAVAVLAGWRIAQPTPWLVTGIPLADIARIVRYDSAVPVFGLAALLTMELHPTRSRYLLASGLLVGLAALSHLYGAFWLPALFAAIILRKRQRPRSVLLVCAGFGLALAPWLVFVASGWDDFVGQYRAYPGRFDLLDSRFYIANLTSESTRYQPVLDALKQSFGTGLWLLLLAVGLLWLARHKHWTLIAITAVLCGLFALLLNPKTFNYLATLWPLFALVAAAGWIALWRMTSWRLWRMVLLVVFAGAMAEGLATVGQEQRLASASTPYAHYTESIAAFLPPNSRVLALHHYWLGLAEHTASYRSIIVPVDLTNPQYVEHPIPFAEAAQAFPPNIVLLDQVMLNFLKEVSDPASSLHGLGSEIRAFLAQPNLKVIGVVNDATYGRTVIYQLDADD